MRSGEPFAAVLVPYAAATGKNLVIFPDHLDPASSVHLLGVELAKL